MLGASIAPGYPPAIPQMAPMTSLLPPMAPPGLHRIHHITDSGLELHCIERSGEVTDGQVSDQNLIGLGVAIGANAVIPMALNLQKLAHTRNMDADGNPLRPFYTIPTWWLGLSLMISGEFFNLLAYGFAPTSLVAPVGAVGVFFNAIIATLCMKEPFGRTDVLGLLSIAGGVVMVVIAVPEVQMDLTSPIIWNNVRQPSGLPTARGAAGTHSRQARLTAPTRW